MIPIGGSSPTLIPPVTSPSVTPVKCERGLKPSCVPRPYARRPQLSTWHSRPWRMLASSRLPSLPWQRRRRQSAVRRRPPRCRKHTQEGSKARVADLQTSSWPATTLSSPVATIWCRPHGQANTWSTAKTQSPVEPRGTVVAYTTPPGCHRTVQK